MTASGGDVTVDMADGIATVTIRNPAKRNSIDLPMLDRLTAVGRDLRHDDAVACVVLQGEGGTFCAGLDFDTLTADLTSPDYFSALDDRFTAAAGEIAAIPVPVIAKVRGGCMGGGVQLALAADLRFAADSAKLGIPAARFGIVYPLAGLQDLVRLGGAAAAKRLLWSATPITAAEARDIGWFDTVLADDALDGDVAALAAAIAGHPRETVTAYKHILDGLAAGADRDGLAERRATANRSPELIARLQAIRDQRRGG
jgi:enoyl-CoA hydratase/carnithine racemase